VTQSRHDVNDHRVDGLALVEQAADNRSRRRIDHEAVERAARDLLRALGADVDVGALEETPRRVADAYSELLTPQPFRATTFPNDDGYDELIVARAIPFHSLCMHHLLPFHGVAHVGYLPGERIIGLSKLGRVVECFSRDLQIQERLTTQIAGWLQDELEPKGVGVVLEAEHLCMSLRGVQKLGAKTVTSALRGLVRDDARTRQEIAGVDLRGQLFNVFRVGCGRIVAVEDYARREEALAAAGVKAPQWE
jgi:GTP cyclohydrolase I